MQAVFLSDFQSSSAIPSFNQTDLNKIYLKFLSVAACLLQEVKTKEKANEILLDFQQKMDSYGVKSNFIAHRKAAILPNNYFEGNNKNLKLPIIYQNIYEQPNGANVVQRTKQHSIISYKILEEWFGNNIELNDEIKLITSSAYESPNVLQKFISEKALNVLQSHTYANDCYGAFPAIEQAIGSIFNTFNHTQSISLVHIELNSLHINLTDATAENLIKMTLFGDGAIHYKVSNERKLNSFQLLKIAHHLIPNSSDQMTWQPGPFNYQMTLKSYVPLFINDNIKTFLNKLFFKSEYLLNDCIKNAIWAIHPGGPKIVQFIKDKLSLSDEQVQYSYEVLKENGNMSSATLPYIWQKIIDEPNIDSGRMIVSLAFGPGLTVYGMIMKKI